MCANLTSGVLERAVSITFSDADQGTATGESKLMCQTLDIWILQFFKYFTNLSRLFSSFYPSQLTLISFSLEKLKTSQ